MRFLLLLIACNHEPLLPGSTQQDLAAHDDQAVHDLSSNDLPTGCLGPNILGPCNEGTICDYGSQRCICQQYQAFLCNPAGCPDQEVFNSSPCSQEGLACYYNLSENHCVDGTWIVCGDAAGQACQMLQFGVPPQEGSVCCPNDYATQLGYSCPCTKGLQCSCLNYHVRCEACDL
jgi:hypothetical protein